MHHFEKSVQFWEEVITRFYKINTASPDGRKALYLTKELGTMFLDESIEALAAARARDASKN